MKTATSYAAVARTLAIAATLLSCAAIGAQPARPAAEPPQPDATTGAKTAQAAPPPRAPAPRTNAPASVMPQVATYNGPSEVGPALQLVIGRSALVPLGSDAARLSIGNPEVADVVLINPREAYIVGRKVGSTNLFVWTKNGHTTLIDVSVDLDRDGLKSRLDALVSGTEMVKVASLADSIVLTGRVSDAIKAERLVALAQVYSGGEKKVVNMLSVEGSQQVMLEVKVAEVSKTLLDRLGVEWNLTHIAGGTTWTLVTQMLAGVTSSLTANHPLGTTRGSVTIDAEVKNDLVKVLAEPTIMAVSGQEGAFLAGGRIFIPVPQTSGFGATTITLEEKEFGVGLRFIPTVLEDGRINLRVTPEVSELSQLGTPVTANGQTNVLPSITTRRASTTVQLRDGETFAIGGLIKNNVTEAVRALPVLGELPVLGALFRSSNFQTDRSELLFIVTPHLVKPMTAAVLLPTDNFVEPTRAEFLIGGQSEGRRPEPPAQSGGFQMK